MKILLMVRNLDFGGAENHVVDLANTLSDLGHEVWIAANEGRRRKLLRNNIRYIQVRYQDHTIIHQVYRLTKIINKYKIQIIHAHQRLPILTGCLAGYFSKIPVIATLHGQLKYDIRSKIVKHLLAQLIVVCPYWLEHVFNQSDILKNKTVMIPNGVRMDGNFVKKHSSTSTLNLVYASRIDKSHGKILESLIEKVLPHLVAQYPKLQLFIVGDGKHLDYLKNLSMKISQQTKKKNIFFLGYQETLSDTLENANLVFGVGRVALESLALGIPVLPIRHDHLGEIITTENFDYLVYNNFVPRNNPEYSTEKIVSILSDFINNTDYYYNETQKISNIVEGEYGLKVIVGKVIDLYYSVINLNKLK